MIRTTKSITPSTIKAIPVNVHTLIHAISGFSVIQIPNMSVTAALTANSSQSDVFSRRASNTRCTFLKPIRIWKAPYNLSSQRLCEKLGMRREGLFVEFVSFVSNPDGTPRYENTMQYAILKKEWDGSVAMEIQKSKRKPAK